MPPPVTVSGQAPPSDDAGRPARTGRVVLLLVAVVGVVAVTSSSDPPPPPQVSLSVDPDGVSTSRTGHVVVPVRVAVRGPALRVEGVEVTAAPVLSPPESTGATRVRADSSAGVVAIVQPDCARLGGGFTATAVVRLAGDGVRVERSVDLHAVPRVAELVDVLCGVPGAASGL